MHCPACGYENRESARFCGECGASVSGVIACSNCGTENPTGQRFCDTCGQRLANVSGSDDAIAVRAQCAVPSASQTPTPASGDQNPSVLSVPSVVQSDAPTSFANSRYAVKRFLGEGGKKKVYLAHDTLLDRDVAFALIKTEGLVSRFQRLAAEPPIRQ